MNIYGTIIFPLIFCSTLCICWFLVLYYIPPDQTWIPFWIPTYFSTHLLCRFHACHTLILLSVETHRVTKKNSSLLLVCLKASHFLFLCGGGGECYWDGLQPPVTLSRNKQEQKMDGWEWECSAFYAGGETLWSPAEHWELREGCLTEMIPSTAWWLTVCRHTRVNLLPPFSVCVCVCLPLHGFKDAAFFFYICMMNISANLLKNTYTLEY